jgi:FkbM family methyltransferase
LGNLKLRQTGSSLAYKFGYLAYIWGEVRGLRNRISFTLRLAAAQIAPNLFRRSDRIATARVPLRDFDVVFKLLRGELMPYRQIAHDFESGTIPRGPNTEDWVIIDCGANIGLFALFFRDAHRVIAIEPNPDCWERLDWNLKQNRVPAVIVRAAVSESETPVRMTFTDRTTVFSRVSPDGETAVNTTTLDAVVAEHKLNRVDLLKLDLEGHEIEALRGAQESLSRSLFRWLYIEYHGHDQLVRLDAFLHDFKYGRVREGHFNALYEPKA